MKASTFIANLQRQVEEYGDCELHLYLDDRRFTRLTVNSINHTTISQTGEPVLAIAFDKEEPT